MSCPMESNLDQVLAETYSCGYSCHGDLELELPKFAAHLTAVLVKHFGSNLQAFQIASFIQNLHIADLYLAVACANQSTVAWNRFVSNYQKLIGDVAAFVSPTLDAGRELAATVMVDMFLPDNTGRSRIASYEGRSSLATWLRIVIANRAINERLLRWNSRESIENIAHIADIGTQARIETSLRSGRYEAMISDCLENACRELTQRERLVLLLRYSDELQVSQIARLLSVHPSNVTRQIERIRRKLHDNVIALLRVKYALDQIVIDECLADLIENPYYSLLSTIGKLSQSER
ncbi:MAG TPA: sigma-70 family RNA polymerase sigma factor [Blastocatellia bacterium]|nr:sigma-70 family RNA polymerase sigma factor [Blastocatellia bacterium]